MPLNDALMVTDATPTRCFGIEELAVGQSVCETVIFDSGMLEGFDRLAHDRAPIHFDDTVAQSAGYERRIVQGLAVTARFSRLIGMFLPGERAVLMGVEATFRHPVYAGTPLLYQVTVERILRPTRTVLLTLSVSDGTRACVTGRGRCQLR